MSDLAPRVNTWALEQARAGASIECWSCRDATWSARLYHGDLILWIERATSYTEALAELRIQWGRTRRAA